MAGMPRSKRSSPTRRVGSYRSRVFVGGSYHQEMRSRLEDIKAAVTAAGFHPVVADEVRLENADDIHHETMVLLHSCRLAVFELSQPSGAFMEIERVPDYGIQTLILFSAPKENEYTGSRMLATFVKEHTQTIQLRPYFQPDYAKDVVVEWLNAMRKEGYG